MLSLYKKVFLERPGVVLLIAAASLAPMGLWTKELFSDVRADLKEMLPESAPSVKTLRALEKQMGGWSELAIIVESPDSAANRRFSDDLVQALLQIPEMRSVRNKTGDEGEFFSERRHLYIDLKDLETIKDRIEDAANDARRRANPLLVDLEDEGPVELDLSDIEKKYQAKIEAATRFPEKYFESPDKKQLAIVARKRGLAFGIADNLRVVQAAEKAIAALDPTKYHPRMRVQLGGDVKNMVEEHESLVEDLTIATVITFVLLGGVVVAFFRNLRSLVLFSMPMLVGLLWTFGLGHFLVGYLNASSAFLGPIVAGNGINFGLILLARYVEERRAGRDTNVSILDAVTHTASATSTAAIAAAISYGSLMATQFRGFRHFGMIGGLGMVLCWLATFALLPAMIAWSERIIPMKMARTHWIFEPGKLASLPFKIMATSPAAFAWAGVLTGLLSAGVAAWYLRDPFEKDFEKLRSTYAREKGASVVAKRVDEIFGRYSGPQVIVADEREDVAEIVAYLEKVIAEGGENRPITEAISLDSLVPKDQAAKLEVLREIRKLLSDDVLANLDPEKRKLAEAQRPPADLRTFTSTNLPESVRSDFRELDGREGRVVLVLPNYKLNLYHADEIKRVADVLRRIPLSGGRIAESSGNFVIYTDMLELVSHDGPRATLLSFAGVLVLCVIVYRRRGWLPVTGALLLGVAWLFALFAGTGLRINFLNFIALPITFGIGVDYAVNVYSRYLIERAMAPPKEAIRRAVISTGGAVTLCSATTIIGYGSLLIARNGSLISFGKAAIFGELTCLTAAVLILPAWIYTWAKER